jgi:hypothetical protein
MSRERIQLRDFIVAAGLVLSSYFWLLALRFVSLPFLVAAWVLYFRLMAVDYRPAALSWLLFALLSFSPIDVMPIHRRWPPRIVPLVMGLPRPETVQRAKRGEVVLGGCIVSGFEPKYYVVW